MNRANQEKLLQDINIGIVSIRLSEIDYFTNYFSHLGTEAAILVGAIITQQAQVPGFNGNNHYAFHFLYFTFATASLTASVHLLLASVFLTVYAQGLALRGPIGSMIKAIEGMIAEQKYGLINFVLSLLLFEVAEIGLFFVTMDSGVATVCTIIIWVGVFITYQYTLRIYNRFNYQDDEIEWDGTKLKHGINTNDLDGDYLNKKYNSADADLKQILLQRKNDKKNKKFKLMNLFRKRKNSNSDHYEPPSKASINNHNDDYKIDIKSIVSHNDHYEDIHFIEKQTIQSNVKYGLMGGYITMKTNKKFMDPWERKFVIISQTNIFLYHDKKKYEDYPNDPINKRPIDIEGYGLVAGAQEPPYYISLVPLDKDDIRKGWQFRCDTLGEFNDWIEMLSKALNDNDETSSRNQMSVMNDGNNLKVGTPNDVRNNRASSVESDLVIFSGKEYLHSQNL